MFGGLLPYLSCSHRLESNKCTPKWESRLPDSCVYITYRSYSQPSSSSYCLMVKWDFTMVFQMKMFPKRGLQNETWFYSYLIEDNPRPYFINYDRVHVLQEASRVLCLHLKVLFKDCFISSSAGKLNFFLT